MPHITKSCCSIASVGISQRELGGQKQGTEGGKGRGKGKGKAEGVSPSPADYWVWGSVVSSPSVVWRRAPPEKWFWCIFSFKNPCIHNLVFLTFLRPVEVSSNPQDK